MKKKNAVFTGAVMIFLIVCAVLFHNADRKRPSQVVLTEHEGIRLEVKAVDREKKCLKVLFSDQTDETIWYYPYEWAMERKENNTWYTMEKQNDDQGIEGPAIEAQPLEIGETKEMAFNWERSTARSLREHIGYTSGSWKKGIISLISERSLH